MEYVRKVNFKHLITLHFNDLVFAHATKNNNYARKRDKKSAK